MASPSVSFFDHHFPFVSAHEQQHEARNGKEDAVHDAERKAGLQHCTRLVDVRREWAASIKAVGAQAHVEGAIVTEVGAVGLGNTAQLVNARNERTNEAEVNEGDEDGGFASRLSPEEGHDRPDTGQDGDDEKDEDVGWCELVLSVVCIHEIGL